MESLYRYAPHSQLFFHMSKRANVPDTHTHTHTAYTKTAAPSCQLYDKPRNAT